MYNKKGIMSHYDLQSNIKLFLKYFQILFQICKLQKIELKERKFYSKLIGTWNLRNFEPNRR
jgi:hypothetical protein